MRGNHVAFAVSMRLVACPSSICGARVRPGAVSIGASSRASRPALRSQALTPGRGLGGAGGLARRGAGEHAAARWAFCRRLGSIGTQGLTETITQSSQRGIIDFNSFSIGKSGTVKINNGAGATLNRVTRAQLCR